jgi:hypothetical protein
MKKKTPARKRAMKKKERQKRLKTRKREKKVKRKKVWPMNLVPPVEKANFTSKVEKMRAEDGLDD